jgi:hypothetical protein
LVLAVVRIMNVEAAQGLTAVPPPSIPGVDAVLVTATDPVVPMDRDFLETALKALEYGRD